jgi:hypothetical protein
MNLRKVINRRIRHEGKGMNVVADVNAALAASDRSDDQHVSVSTKQRIVQRTGPRRGEEEK